ncbi:MAG TPA: hypothetical protein VD811_07860 [Desulfuromonadales bacterium]|nr:hypothetical protein [Desulfuromonadales bacterium]
MYSSTEHAREELRKRRTDLKLRREVETWLGAVPEFLRGEPRAVLARQVATPNFEFCRFVEAAQRTGLKPVCPEYRGDKFSSRNPDKVALAKMTFHHGKGRKNGDRNTTHRVINFYDWDGKPLNRIETLWGEQFLDFHHRLLARQFPGVEIADNTDWLKRMGGKPSLFWPRLFALFLCHGLMFDNFHPEGHETVFTREVIQPALAEVTARFGRPPLIVPLVPVETERDLFWSWYPEPLEQEVRCLTGEQTASGARLGGAYA